MAPTSYEAVLRLTAAVTMETSAGLASFSPAKTNCLRLLTRIDLKETADRRTMLGSRPVLAALRQCHRSHRYVECSSPNVTAISAASSATCVLRKRSGLVIGGVHMGNEAALRRVHGNGDDGEQQRSVLARHFHAPLAALPKLPAVSTDLPDTFRLATMDPYQADVPVDDTFWTRPATLVALGGSAPSRDVMEIRGEAVRQASLVELVALVMKTHPAERWRYSIVTDDDPWMTATDIEAVAFRGDFPFTDALETGRHTL